MISIQHNYAKYYIHSISQNWISTVGLGPLGDPHEVHGVLFCCYTSDPNAILLSQSKILFTIPCSIDVVTVQDITGV